MVRVLSMVCPACGGGGPDDPEPRCCCGGWAQPAPIPKAKLNGQEWELIRHLLMVRSGGRCEVSGAPITDRRGWSVQHRRPGRAGGTLDLAHNALSNLLAVTGDGTTGAHGWIEHNRQVSTELGWLVGDGVSSPADVPVVLYSGRIVHLDPLNPFYLEPEGPTWRLDPLPQVPLPTKRRT